VVSRYEVEFTARAADELADLPKLIAQRILEKVRWLSENFAAVAPVPLAADLAGIFKLRVGDYRVLYTYDRDPGRIRIERIRHRRDVYKNL